MKKVIILTVMLLVFLAGCEKDNKLESFHYKNDSGYHSLVYLSPSQVEALESLDKRIEMLEERPYIAFESATQSYDSLHPIYGGPYEIMVIKEGKPE